MNVCDCCGETVTDDKTCWLMASPLCEPCFANDFIEQDYPCENGHYHCASEPRGECSNARFDTQTAKTVR